MVPSNFTALADVVIGSKTSINYITRNGQINFKNALGTYYDPAAVVLDSRLYEKLPLQERRFGMTECLKHGLLQDRTLFGRIAAQMKSDAPEILECSDIAYKVLQLKSRILARFPWETGGGRVLRFGHVHAHAMERVSGFSIPHASSVLWGMLVELKLCSPASDAAYKELLAVVKSRIDFGQLLWKSIDPKDIVREGQFDPNTSGSPYYAITVPEVGHYTEQVPDMLIEEPKTPEQLLAAMLATNHDIFDHS